MTFRISNAIKITFAKSEFVFVIKNVVADKVSISYVFRGVGWFLLADVVTVAILIAFPATVLWLPSLISG